MSVLSPFSLRSYLEYGMITPWYERTELEYNLNPSGSDGSPSIFKLSYGLGPAGYDVRIDNDYYVFPGQLKLAATIEKFKMPLNLIAFVHDKSTWIRRGLAVQNTVIEPGWRGYLTLELTNHIDRLITLTAGMPIAQIIFHELTDASPGYEGKYQDQEQGPQTAR